MEVCYRRRSRHALPKRIDSRQAGQRLRIHAVVFLAALPDQTHVPRMRYDHFVSDSLSSRLTHGECIPVSSTMRHRGMTPNTSRIAFGVVPRFCSRSTSPTSSSRQYQLERSSRSRPIVSFGCEKFLIFAATVLTFFLAGLLYLLCFEHVDNLGAYSIPSETGLLIPSDCARWVYLLRKLA